MSLVAGVILFAVSYLLTTLIFPNYSEEIRQAGEQAMRAQQIPEADIAASAGGLCGVSDTVQPGDQRDIGDHRHGVRSFAYHRHLHAEKGPCGPRNMTIVVLDAHTLNPGDLDWEPLRALGTCRIYDRTGNDEIASRSSEADILLTNKTPVSRAVIAASPRLRYIGVLATGYNVVDTEAAREREIPVCNVPTYGTMSVAQMAMAHLLHLTLRVGDHAASTRAGDWSRSEDFCYWRFPLTEVAPLTFGVVGYGRIGQAMRCMTCKKAGPS